MKSSEHSNVVHFWRTIARVAVSVSAICLWGHTAQAAVNIDNFDLTAQSAVISGLPAGLTSKANVVLAPEAIGAEHDLYVTRTSAGAGSISADVDLTVDGFLAYASGPFTKGNALIEWDGVDMLANSLAATGLGAVDLTQGGTNTGILIKASSDLGTTLVVKVYSSATNFSTATVTVPPDPSFTIVTFFIPFTLFATGGGSGVDFTHVGAVTLFIDGSIAATDVFVDLIAATNQPGSGTTGTGSIGDFVWYDQDHDGLQDAGEPGIGGVTLNLLDATSLNLLAMTTTDANGAYHFTGLCAGNYVVAVDATTLPPGFTPTTSNVGGNDTIDSDGSPVAVSLPTDNTSNQTIDFGYQSPCTGTMGNFVWNDLNGNGLQDIGEPGIGGVTVTLKNSGVPLPLPAPMVSINSADCVPARIR